MTESFASVDGQEEFILRITYKIWEEGDIEAIRVYYSQEVPVRSPSGVSVGAQAVIDATKATLKEFPDRQLIGEDVIHARDGEEWLSSHRIFSTATHLGHGYFGAPTNRFLQYRVIADCAVRDGVIFDEWLVRDFGAIVRQLGMDPETFARKLVAESGGTTRTSDIAFSFTPAVYRSTGNHHIAGQVLRRVVENVVQGDLSKSRSLFDRAAQFELPGGRTVNGRDNGLNALKTLFAPVEAVEFSLDHVMGDSDSRRGVRAAVRNSAKFRHARDGWLGQPTNRELLTMAIWHADFIGDKIRRLFLLLDEVALWRQILSSP